MAKAPTKSTNISNFKHPYNLHNTQTIRICLYLIQIIERILLNLLPRISTLAIATTTLPKYILLQKKLISFQLNHIIYLHNNVPIQNNKNLNLTLTAIHLILLKLMLLRNNHSQQLKHKKMKLRKPTMSG